jgi:hypothetical protein
MTRTLFVGGPRHGGSIDDDSQAFTDILTGAAYVRKPVQFTTAHPVTKRPEWTYEREVFVSLSLTQPIYLCHKCEAEVPQAHANTGTSTGHPVEVRQPAAMVFQAAQDAIMRDWFVSEGRKSKAVQHAEVVPPSTEDARNNGAGEPVRRVVYTAYCPTCNAEDGRTRLAFETLRERGEWAAKHIEATGHELEFSEVPV